MVALARHSASLEVPAGVELPPDLQSPLEFDSLLTREQLPAGLGDCLAPAVTMLSAAASADRIDYMQVRKDLLGGAPIGAAAVLAARLDLAAGRPGSAVQRTADLLTIARDLFAANEHRFDAIASMHVQRVCQLWSDAALGSLPDSELQRLASVATRFVADCAPNSNALPAEASWLVRELAAGSSSMGPADADLLLTAIESVPAAPWRERRVALAALKQVGWPGDPLFIEQQRRSAIAAFRMLAMAIEHHRGQPLEPLMDPLGDAALSVTADSDDVVLRSQGHQPVAPLERRVRRR